METSPSLFLSFFIFLYFFASFFGSFSFVLFFSLIFFFLAVTPPARRALPPVVQFSALPRRAHPLPFRGGLGRGFEVVSIIVACPIQRRLMHIGCERESFPLCAGVQSRYLASREAHRARQGLFCPFLSSTCCHIRVVVNSNLQARSTVLSRTPMLPLRDPFFLSFSWQLPRLPGGPFHQSFSSRRYPAEPSPFPLGEGRGEALSLFNASSQETPTPTGGMSRR